MHLSVLELGYLLPGVPAAPRLREVAALGPLLERLGYDRYWFAEHHASHTAFASPEPLVAHVAATTSRIRVGTAGVLMNVHTPVRVAQVFRALSALHPGRIDLGVAAGAITEDYASVHCPGVDFLEQARSGIYGRRVEQLVAHLRGQPAEGPIPGPDVSPIGHIGPNVICMGAGKGRGNMVLAARHGLSFCYSLFHTGAKAGPEVIREYRERFVPSPGLPRPHVLVAVNFICGESNAAAAATLSRLRMWEPLYRPAVLGRPGLCREQIESILREHDADELVLVTAYEDMVERIEAYQLLAEACELAA
jgi:luciferase family oxidoreductase group 1